MSVSARVMERHKSYLRALELNPGQAYLNKEGRKSAQKFI